MGLLFRSSQRHFDVKEWTEISIDGIGCLRLRIEKEIASQIYGTLNIPILSYKDPVTAKLIRSSHWMRGDVSRGVHNLTKSTLANLVKREAAVFWKGQQRNVRRVIQECGICRRFDEKVCRPTLGRSLFRCRVGAPPFQYVSLDPPGAVRVQMTGSHSGKISPLIICDLNNGAVSVEHMTGDRAEHVFLTLQRLQYRWKQEER